ESDVKSSNGTSSSTQNVAFVSSENTDSTNNVSTAYVGSTTSGNNLQKEFPSSSSLLTNQSSCGHDLYEIEEIHNKSGRKIAFDAKEPVGFDKTKVECYNCHKTGHFAKECKSKKNQDSMKKDAWKAKDTRRRSGNQEESNALMTLDGEGIDWTAHAYDEEDNFALMAFSNSNSDTEEKIRYMTVDLDDKTNLLTYHKKLLDEAEKEKAELTARVKSWQKSSDLEDTPENDRYAEGMHAVPPPMSGISIPSGPKKEIDESQFTYGPR
ncbi:ribonuclease H-like domain-containing protein, partial [Tanacetum coccineum]